MFDSIIRLWPTGAGWNHLADRYPSASTCRPRLQSWEKQGVWLQIWPKFLSKLEQQGQLDWPETAVWPGPKKGPIPWKEQRRQGWMVVVDGQGFPIDADLDSTSAGEIKRLEATIEKVTVPRKGTGRPRQNPVRIIADKGYDSDPLGQRRLKGGIELICPCRKNKQTKKDEGGANCGLAGVDGRLSRLLRGSQTGEDWLLVGKEKFRSSKRSSTLLASSLH